MTTDPLPRLQAHCGHVQGPSDNILNTENGYHIRQISLPAAERERETLNTVSCFSGGYAPVSYLPGLFACAVGTRFLPCIPGFCRLVTAPRSHSPSTYHPLPPHIPPTSSPRTTRSLPTCHSHPPHVRPISHLRLLHVPVASNLPLVQPCYIPYTSHPRLAAKEGARRTCGGVHDWVADKVRGEKASLPLLSLPSLNICLCSTTFLVDLKRP
jgi:hypothetical protein